jgi:hypothetical protein
VLLPDQPTSIKAQREMLMRRDYATMTHEEIAAALGVPRWFYDCLRAVVAERYFGRV